MSTPSLRITLGQHSQAGRKAVNQDFHGATIPREPQLGRKGIVVALADGIGSSAVSGVASAAAVRGFLDDYYCTSEAWTVRRAAQRVLDATNSWLHAQNQRSEARFDRDRGYVCTFSALILKGREAHLLHVGDARIYRLHAQSLEQLTQDHRVHVSSVETYLGRALGAGPAVEIDYRCWALEAGEVYVLATDGVYAHLDAMGVHAALSAHPHDLDAAAAALTASALALGSDDNLTVQLVRVDALPDVDADAQQIAAQRLGLKLPPRLQARMRFEDYTIVRELHASARSHVHLAIDELSGQQIALKTPSIDLREDAAHLDRFMLEEWVARRIDSAHVLKPCPVERPREHLYVAMEYVPGQTLSQWMTDHPAPDLDSVRRIVAQIAKGLQAFHRKEMLHQDLRPDNVMIDATGTVKIIDFGSVHVAGLQEGTSAARPQAIVGTLQYTAPEYFIGGEGCMQSDLFSLGVITYQMLTGQLPYGLQVPRLRSPKDLQGLRYVPLREHRPELPAWIDSVLRKTLHPQPHKRQEALSEFVADLTTPGPQFRNQRTPPIIERHPVLFWQVLTLVQTLALIIVAAVWWQHGR